MTKTCSVAGCPLASKARGFCPMHYQRWKRHGDPTVLVRLHDPLCSINGCGRPYMAKGLCEMHHTRARHGRDLSVPVAPRAPRGSGTVTYQGYVKVGRTGHPLASGRDGSVFAHRVVLYDAIGPGPHPCNWCGKTLEWRPGRLSADALVVDHLDFNRSNNDCSNLVVSCSPCNAKRRPPSQFELMPEPEREAVSA